MDSIRKLMSLGINTPDVMVLACREDVYSFIKSEFNNWEKVSIRTDNKRGKAVYEKWGLPFYPNRSQEKALKILGKELLSLVDDKIDILVAKGINPEESLLSGKYMRGDVEVVEYIIGPSTVRDVDEKIPPSWNVYGETMPHDLSRLQLPINLPYSLFHTVEQTDRGFRTPYILEFSVYPYGVGKLNKPLIFWEVIEEKTG